MNHLLPLLLTALLLAGIPVCTAAAGHSLIADFAVNTTAGAAPIAVQFSDLSTGHPTAWLWDFGDGTCSTDQNPVHVYAAPGYYSVVLTGANRHASDTNWRTGYIGVYGPPVASFTANVTGGAVPFTIQFTDTSTGNPDQWVWSYQPGQGAGLVAFSTGIPNPILTVPKAGVYGIYMNCSNGYGENRTGRAMNITALPRVAGDLNRNGRLDFADVVLFFNGIGTMPYAADLDFNANGRMDFGDAVALFARL